jgi:hypothetical protein
METPFHQLKPFFQAFIIGHNWMSMGKQVIDRKKLDILKILLKRAMNLKVVENKRAFKNSVFQLISCIHKVFIET